MKITHRLLSIILTLVMVLTLVPAFSVTALATTEGWNTSGTCEWKVDGTTLTIRPENNGATGTLAEPTGSGGDYWPWYNIKGNITKIVIGSEGHTVVAPTSCYCMFQTFRSLTTIEGLTNFDTSNVINMNTMFSYCDKLESIDLSHFNTSKVTDMSSMFNMCKALTTIDVSSFDTSKVTDMSGMFNGCITATSIEFSDKFDTSKVTNMCMMFDNCYALESLDVTGFDTSNVEDMSLMFEYCKVLTSLDLSGFNTAKVYSMYGIFGYCDKLDDQTRISYINTLRSTNGGLCTDWTAGLFAGCPGTTLDFTGLDTTGATDFTSMFRLCENLTSLDLTCLNTADMVSMYSMFEGCTSLTTLNLTDFDTSNVEEMGAAFRDCTSLTTLDLTSFDTSKNKSTWTMFYTENPDGMSLKAIYVDPTKWSTAAVTQSWGMFTSCTAIVGGEGTTYDANHVDVAYAHVDGGTGNPGYLSLKPVASITKDGGTNVYSTVQKAIDAAKPNDTVKLVADVTENITIKSDDVLTLDLNGYVLEGTGSGSVITVNGALTLTDSGITAVHNFKVGSDGLWTLTDETSTVNYEDLAARPAAGAVVAVKGGCITGGVSDDVGGGIYVAGNAVLILAGGNIIGNKSTDKTEARGGGGVFVGYVTGNENGSFTMNGGVIAGNVSGHTGGGVSNWGEMTLNGGFIAYNTAAEWSGGIYTGRNSGCTDGSTFTMYSGIITGNIAGDCGGGISTNYLCIVKLLGGNITGNKADMAGGVESSWQSSNPYTLGGSIEITGNTLLDGSTPSNLYIYKNYTVSLATGDDAPANMNVGVTVEATPTEGSPVAITGTNSADYSGYFTSDNLAYTAFNDGTGSNQVVKLGVHTHEWSYSLSTTTSMNDTINATCSGNIGTCTDTNKSITIVKPSLTKYAESGKSANATLSGTTLGGLTVSTSDIKYEGVSPTQYTESTTAPTNAGTYKASITVEGKTAYVEYTIAKKQLNVSGTTANDKSYDSSTSATIGAIGTVTGIVAGDKVTVTPTGTFENKNAGNGKNVTITYALSGDDAENYIAPSNATTTAVIYRRSLSISNVTVADKLYDGTTKATVTNCSVGGIITGDDVTVTPFATFDSKDVGTNKTASVTFTLSGADANNYTLSGSTTSADINKRSITITSATASKEYDGTPLTNSDITVSGDGFAGNDDENITYTVTGSQTEVGSSTNTFTYAFTQGLESCYDVTTAAGILTVTAKQSSSDNGSGAYAYGGGSSSTVTVPVSGDKDTVKVSASVSGNTATVKEVTSDEITKLGTGDEVVMDLSGLSKSVTGVSIPKTTFENVAASDAEGLEIKMPNGTTVVFDKEVLSAVASQAGGKDIQLVIDKDSKAESSMTSAQKETVSNMNNAVVLDAYFVSNGKRISDFKGGEAELTAEYPTVHPVRVWYVADNGDKTAVPCTYDGKTARFIVTHFSHYVIEELEESSYAACPKDSTCVLSKFPDAEPKAWYHDGMHFCVENAYINGTEKGLLMPKSSITRAQVCTILWNIAGKPTANYAMNFTDIVGNEWYAEAIRWAASEGIVKGYETGAFGPKNAVTREQLAQMLYGYAKKQGKGFTGSWMFLIENSDANKISGWANEAMHWTVMNKITTGDENGLLNPKGTATRAEAATMIQRFCEAIAE